MRIARLAALSCLVALLAGCSTVESRIRKNEATFLKLPEAQKQQVLLGRVDEGMSPAAVYLAWGDPGEVARGSIEGKIFEEWRYFIYEQEFVSNYSATPVYAGRGRYFLSYVYDPVLVPTRRLWRRVVFEKEKVVSWESVQGI